MLLYTLYLVGLWLLMILSLIAMFWFWFNEDHSIPTKIVALVMAAVPVVMQFLDPLPDQVHFAIPWAIQLALIGWWGVLYKEEIA